MVHRNVTRSTCEGTDVLWCMCPGQALHPLVATTAPRLLSTCSAFHLFAGVSLHPVSPPGPVSRTAQLPVQALPRASPHQQRGVHHVDSGIQRRRYRSTGFCPFRTYSMRPTRRSDTHPTPSRQRIPMPHDQSGVNTLSGSLKRFFMRRINCIHPTISELFQI